MPGYQLLQPLQLPVQSELRHNLSPFIRTPISEGNILIKNWKKLFFVKNIVSQEIKNVEDAAATFLKFKMFFTKLVTGAAAFMFEDLFSGIYLCQSMVT